MKSYLHVVNDRARNRYTGPELRLTLTEDEEGRDLRPGESLTDYLFGSDEPDAIAEKRDAEDWTPVRPIDTNVVGATEELPRPRHLGEEPSDGAEISERDAILRFILAGRAVFTLRSPTGTRFTYKVSKGKKDDAPHFVGLLDSADNVDGYSYMGTIFDGSKYRSTKRSHISPSAPSAKGFAWFFERLVAGRDLKGLEFWHEGRCGACGRPLTVPESIEAGIGPVCAGKEGF